MGRPAMSNRGCPNTLPDRRTKVRISEREEEEDVQALVGVAGITTHQTLILVRVDYAAQKHESRVEVLQAKSHHEVQQDYH